MSANRATVIGKISKRAASQKEYGGLVGRAIPHVIHSRAENEHYTALLESLDRKAKPTPAEQDLAELLTVLIDNFEEQHYALRRSTPLESLKELMAANDLRQKDLVDVFGTPSIVSEVLSGKRKLTAAHIRRLSERFSVTPELFF